MDNAFSIEESLRFAWKKLKEHSAILFTGSLIIFALNLVSSLIDKKLANTTEGILLGILVVAATIVLDIGYTIVGLKIARGHSVVMRELIPPAKLFWNVFLASLLVGVIVLGGLVLLIIPGIYFMVRFMMATYAVIDGEEIVKSLKRSTELTEGHKWELFWFIVVIVIINILGAIPFGLGMLLTLPITTIAFAHVYDKLKHAHHAHATPTPHEHEGHEHPHA